MASVYLAEADGDGLSTTSGFRPPVPTGTPYVIMFLDPVSKGTCFVSSDDTLTGPTLMRVLTGTTWSDLRIVARGSSVPSPRKTELNTWATNHGLTPVPPGTTDWRDAILHICRQVEPAAELDTTYLGPPE